MAETEPERLAQMVDLWWQEAEKYQVLPLDNRLLEALLDPRRAPPEARPPGGVAVRGTHPEIRVIGLRNRPHRLTASVEIPNGGAEGVLVAMGTVLGGWSLHLREGRLRYVHNFVGTERQAVDSPGAVPPGRHLLVFEFETAGKFRGHGRLRVDGAVVGEGDIRRVPMTRYTLTGGGLTCGWEQGPAVGEDYTAPFRFTGTLHWVALEANGRGDRDPAAEFDAIMAEQ